MTHNLSCFIRTVVVVSSDLINSAARKQSYNRHLLRLKFKSGGPNRRWEKKALITKLVKSKSTKKCKDKNQEHREHKDQGQGTQEYKCREHREPRRKHRERARSADELTKNKETELIEE